jgi:hypothetical protein
MLALPWQFVALSDMQLVMQTCSIGVMPVPPAIMPISFFMLGSYLYFSRGPLKARLSPTLQNKKPDQTAVDYQCTFSTSCWFLLVLVGSCTLQISQAQGICAASIKGITWMPQCLAETSYRPDEPSISTGASPAMMAISLAPSSTCPSIFKHTLGV